jgi:type IV secretion system protein VirB5
MRAIGKTISVLAMLLPATMGSRAARAQWAVFDAAALSQMLTQLEQAKKQYEQMQQTHNSFNKLTSMADVASVLSRPEVRNALPKDFASVAAALQGKEGVGVTTWTDKDQVSMPSGTAYSEAIKKQQGQSSGTKNVAEQMYQATGKRLEGLEQLRGELARSEDPKTTADLQARLGIEMAAGQQDLARLQAIQMVAAADERAARVEADKRSEAKLDAEIRGFSR